MRSGKILLPNARDAWEPLGDTMRPVWTGTRAGKRTSWRVTWEHHVCTL